MVAIGADRPLSPMASVGLSGGYGTPGARWARRLTVW